MKFLNFLSPGSGFPYCTKGYQYPYYLCLLGRRLGRGIGLIVGQAMARASSSPTVPEGRHSSGSRARPTHRDIVLLVIYSSQR
jgi:hypothetical protein